MKGVLVSDMESAIKKNEFFVDELDSLLAKIDENCNTLLSSLDYENFRIYKSKVLSNTNEFANVRLRLNSYNQVLSNVLQGYVSQAGEIAVTMANHSRAQL